jgi:hypothetical protein
MSAALSVAAITVHQKKVMFLALLSFLALC